MGLHRVNLGRMGKISSINAELTGQFVGLENKELQSNAKELGISICFKLIYTSFSSSTAIKNR